MTQGIAQIRRNLAPRRALAVVLAIFLNVALVPCTMALEVVEHAHDCCPPELKLTSSDCCEIDDISVGTLGSTAELDESGGVEQAPIQADQIFVVTASTPYYATAGPPHPPGPPVAIHKINCVYLK